MHKRFNVNGVCYPEKHYMVNLDSRMTEIKKMVDYGDYFVINRARQYGKTTVLLALRQYLKEEYAAILLSFQGLSERDFCNESRFAVAFVKIFLNAVWNKKVGITGVNSEKLETLKRYVEGSLDQIGLRQVFEYLSELCSASEKPLVLMIDEVDHASNNQVFLDFLGMFRDYYLRREEVATFQSVILAGVYDIKNLKQKIRSDKEHKYNSPWNIAAKFSVDLSFSISDIVGMLSAYRLDRRIEMDIFQMAKLLYDYTSGYPYFVSAICKIIDEELIQGEMDAEKAVVWTKEQFLAANQVLLNESNTLFDDMRKKIAEYPKLRDLLYAILFYGQQILFNPDHEVIELGVLFGFLKKEKDMVAISNRIFETRLYNLFLSEELLDHSTYKEALQNRNQFLINGYLNMDLVMQKFVEHFTELYSERDMKFLEENARKLFLLYLKPIINGTGNYYVEAQTRDLKRTDVIVDYRGVQFIIEMKIWHGEEYHRKGEEQLADYLDSFHLKKGYLLCFNFNNKKQVGVQTVLCKDKIIVEAMV